MPSAKEPTGPTGWPLLGSMIEARRDPLAFTLRLAREHDDVAGFHLGPYKGYLVSHPEGVRHVLQANHRNYDKHNYDYEMLRPFLGDGLLTSDGEQWLKERRLIQPAFHREQLAKFVGSMHESIRRMLDRWHALVRENSPVDVDREMNSLALEIVSKGLLGAELGGRGARILEAFRVLNTEVALRFQSLLPLPLWLPLPGNLAARRAKAQIDGALTEFITERQGGSHEETLLDVLMQAHGGAANGVIPARVLDELVTLTLAGHETTAALLSWTWYLLAKNPEIAEQVRQEAWQVLSGRAPEWPDLDKLVVTESVLKETLRLYPPVWIISRRAKEDDVIRGHNIRGESVVALSPYATHRDPNYWQEPDRFEPQRFMPARERERPHYAYFPFGGGPRLCIGAGFAMMEAKMVVASVVQRYRLRRLEQEPVRPRALVTLRPERSLRMELRPVRF